MNNAAMSVSFCPDTGELMVRVQESPLDDGQPGRSVTFSGASLRPLGYAELRQANPEKQLAIPMELGGARLLDTNIEGLDRKINYYAKAAVLESKFTSRAIGLVRGGWLPPTLAASNKTVILLDRNIITQIRGRFGGKAASTEPDFLDLFANRPVRINPVLAAMEGNKAAIPTPEQVREQLDEIVKQLGAALPSAKLVVGPDSLRGALGLIEESRAGMERKQQFLIRVAPRLAAPVGKKNRLATRDAVLTVADECGVLRSSLVVLAVLSAVFVANGASPAKRLLKFKPGYREKDAYNALVDLRSLEMLIYLFAWFPDAPTMLCTADKDLALFWTGIRASNFERKDAGVSFSLSPIDALLPGFANEWPTISGSSSQLTD
ncbi:hypothetical protein [Bradyrhizobium sp. USDA 3256]